MEKLDKVIAGLECCTERRCTKCPYLGQLMYCMAVLEKDALELLKVQKSMLEKASEVQKSGDLIRLSDLMKFPIRIDHYDKENGNEHFVYGIETVLEYAENLPRVEAEPVVHAHWEFKSIQQIAPNCSRCGMQSIMGYSRCPHCGAHMDEEVAK